MRELPSVLSACLLLTSSDDNASTLTEQQARMRRRSMENLDLMKITPDKVRVHLCVCSSCDELKHTGAELSEHCEVYATGVLSSRGQFLSISLSR